MDGPSADQWKILQHATVFFGAMTFTALALMLGAHTWIAILVGTTLAFATGRLLHWIRKRWGTQ